MCKVCKHYRHRSSEFLLHKNCPTNCQITREQSCNVMEDTSIQPSDVLEEKVFRALLLLEFYKQQSILKEKEEKFRDILTAPFQHIDDWIWSQQKQQSERLQLSRALDPVEKLLNVHGKVSIQSSNSFKNTCDELCLRQSTSFFFGRQFGHSRFLTVDLGEMPKESKHSSNKRPDRFHGVRLLFDGGLTLAGRRYRFLHAGEKKARERGFLAHFFAEENTEQMTRLTTARLPPVSVDDVINTLGTFPDDIRPMKLDARLQLGFSKSFPLPLPEAFVFMEDDLLGVRAVAPLGEALPSEHIMTDGCGFISASLARTIPYRISSGKVRDQGYTFGGPYSAPSPPRPADYPLPAIIQVRMVCSQGLFKGCLLVTSDTSLCPTDCIVMRRSMRKAAGPCYSPHSSMQGEDSDLCDKIVSLDIVNTFEQTDVNSHKISGENCFAYLNKFSCFFLQQRGVPAELFLAKLEDELQRVLHMVSARDVALEMVRRALFRGIAAEVDVTEEEGEGGGEEAVYGSEVDDMSVLTSSTDDRYKNESYDEWARRLRSSNQLRERSIAERALDFLLAGHSLLEPNLLTCLRNIQAAELSKLKQFKLRIAGAYNLPGAPDPTGTLNPREVYVALPTSKDRAAHTDTAGSVVTGKVVVMRAPTFHRDEIRVLQAVRNDHLAHFLRGTAGGVLFFSVQGERSPADEMGTGDFDGDIYNILFCNNEFVNAVEDTPPVDYSAMTAPVDASLLDAMTAMTISSSTATARKKRKSEALQRSSIPGSDNDLYHMTRLEDLITASESSLLGRSTNALLALLDNPDFGWRHRRTQEMYVTTMRLLDAAKSDMDISCTFDQFNVPFPHFMRPKATSDDKIYLSSSVLGCMYDRVTRCQKDLQALCHLPWSSSWRSVDTDLILDDPHIQPDKYAALKSKWEESYRFYNMSMTNILNPPNKEDDYLNSPPSRNHMMVSGQKLAISDLKMTFRVDFDNDADELCNKALEIYQVSSPRINFDFMRQALAMRCRLVLASILYQVTYNPALGTIPRSFCWEICGQELHYLKADAMKRRNGQSPFALLPVVP